MADKKSPSPTAVIPTCARCGLAISKPNSASIFVDCSHVFDEECIILITKLVSENVHHFYPKTSTATTTTKRGCPKCDGTLAAISNVAPSIPVDQSVIASSSTTTSDLAESGQTLQQLASANITWNMLISRGLKKIHLSRKNGWFDPEYLRTIGITMQILITQLGFTTPDLISRKITASECAALECDAAFLLDKLKPTPRQFFLLGFKFEDVLKHLKLNTETLLRIFYLPGTQTAYVFAQLLKVRLGYTRAPIVSALPDFVKMANVDVLTVLI